MKTIVNSVSNHNDIEQIINQYSRDINPEIRNYKRNANL